jgi:carboxyvinyl-carboxyphosphonate phosphorylmutase
MLEGKRCVLPATVFNALSARMAEQIGFEAMMMPGSMAAASVLAAPDITLLSLTEFAEQTYRICRASSLPLLVDSDHGFGNALNAKRTAEELEAAGVSAMTIEDTLLPAAFGAADETQLIPLEEEVGKLKAALEGRTDPDMAIIARSSSNAVTGLKDAVKRFKAYAKTGVDGLFLAGVNKVSDLEAIAAEVKIPLIVGNNGGDLGTPEELAARGVRICLSGHHPFTAGLQAVYDCLKAIRDGKPDKMPPRASGDFMKKLLKEADYERWTKDFLG